MTTQAGALESKGASHGQVPVALNNLSYAQIRIIPKHRNQNAVGSPWGIDLLFAGTCDKRDVCGHGD